jgi:hypothetical protein
MLMENVQKFVQQFYFLILAIFVSGQYHGSRIFVNLYSRKSLKKRSVSTLMWILKAWFALSLWLLLGQAHGTQTILGMQRQL